MLSRCSKAGFSRRIVLMRSMSDSSGPSSVRSLTSYFSEWSYSSLPARTGDALEALEARVDAVGRAQRRGEHEPAGELRRPAVLQLLGEDVGRVDEEVRPVVVLHAARRQLGDVVRQLPLGALPREVRVGLVEADLRELAHHRRARERLGEEDDLRVALAHLGDQPLPERERLRVRVVDAEDLARRGRPSSATTPSSAFHRPCQSSDSQLTL